MRVKKVVGFDGGARFDYEDEKLKKGLTETKLHGENMHPSKKHQCR